MAVLAVCSVLLSVPVNSLFHGKIERFLQNSTSRRRAIGAKAKQSPCQFPNEQDREFALSNSPFWEQAPIQPCPLLISHQTSTVSRPLPAFDPKRKLHPPTNRPDPPPHDRLNAADQTCVSALQIGDHDGTNILRSHQTLGRVEQINRGIALSHYQGLSCKMR